MKKYFLIAALVLLFAPLLASTEDGSRPLAGREDPVVVSGSVLPGDLLGEKKGSYRAFADYGAGTLAVPFQIEERDANGVILIENGADHDKLDGNFDPSDELVMMAADAGSVRPAAPEGCPKNAVVSVKDPESGAEGYFLVALCETPPPLSEKDYVSYDPKTYTAKSDRYSIGWQKARVFSYDYMSVDGGPDYLDRLKVRCKVGKLGITYSFVEDDFHHEYVGYTDGPVRVTVKLDNYWSLGPLGKLPLAQYYYFYKDSMRQRAGMDLNVNPFLLGFVVNVEIGHDLQISDAGSARVCTNVTPECLPVDAPREKIDELARSRMEWGGIDAPGGDVFIRLVPDPRLKTKVQGLFIYDSTFKAKPEYQLGSEPLISFNMVDWKDVDPDVYYLDFYYYFMKQYSIEEFNRYDRLITNPLVVSCPK